MKFSFSFGENNKDQKPVSQEHIGAGAVNADRGAFETQYADLIKELDDADRCAAADFITESEHLMRQTDAARLARYKKRAEIRGASGQSPEPSATQIDTAPWTQEQAAAFCGGALLADQVTADDDSLKQVEQTARTSTPKTPEQNIQQEQEASPEEQRAAEESAERARGLKNAYGLFDKMRKHKVITGVVAAALIGGIGNNFMKDKGSSVDIDDSDADPVSLSSAAGFKRSSDKELARLLDKSAETPGSINATSVVESIQAESEPVATLKMHPVTKEVPQASAPVVAFEDLPKQLQNTEFPQINLAQDIPHGKAGVTALMSAMALRADIPGDADQSIYDGYFCTGPTGALTKEFKVPDAYLAWVGLSPAPQTVEPAETVQKKVATARPAAESNMKWGELKQTTPGQWSLTPRADAPAPKDPKAEEAVKQDILAAEQATHTIDGKPYDINSKPINQSSESSADSTGNVAHVENGERKNLTGATNKELRTMLDVLSAKPVNTRWRPELNTMYADALTAFFNGARNEKVDITKDYKPAYKRATELLRNPRVLQQVADIAKNHKIDMAVIYALIAVESDWKVDAVSPAGALGLMQMLPAAYQDIQNALDSDIPFKNLLIDPALAIDSGVKYFMVMLDAVKQRFPDVSPEAHIGLAAALYNQGPNVKKSASKDEAIKYVAFLKKATQDYFNRFQNDQKS